MKRVDELETDEAEGDALSQFDVLPGKHDDLIERVVGDVLHVREPDGGFVHSEFEDLWTAVWYFGADHELADSYCLVELRDGEDKGNRGESAMHACMRDETRRDDAHGEGE